MAGSGGLTLVFDTNVLMIPDGLQLFREIAAGQTGTLPASVALAVPHIVLTELQLLSRKPNYKAPHSAHAAYRYLTDPVTRPARVWVESFQHAQKLQDAFYPAGHGTTYRSRNDGLVLMLCLDLYHSELGDVWLISNDQQLGARCGRSGLVCMPFNGLREARELKPYNLLRPLGDDYHTWRTAGPQMRKPACQPLQVSLDFPGAGSIRFTASNGVDRAAAYRRIIDMRRDAQGIDGAEPAHFEPVREMPPLCEQCGCGISAWHRVQREEQLQQYAIWLFLAGLLIGFVGCLFLAINIAMESNKRR